MKKINKMKKITTIFLLMLAMTMVNGQILRQENDVSRTNEFRVMRGQMPTDYTVQPEVTLPKTSKGDPTIIWDFNDGKMPSEFTLRILDNGTNFYSTTYPIVIPADKAWGTFEGDLQATPLTGYCAISQSWFTAATIGNPANRWMILPRIEVGEDAKLQWSARTYQEGKYADGYSVRLSTTDKLLPSSFVTLFTITAENIIWTEREIDLSAYAGQAVYIAFVQDSHDKNMILVDDIKLFGNVSISQDQTDPEVFGAGIVSVVSPSQTNGNSTGTVKVTLANFGNQPIPAGAVSVGYRLNGGAPVMQPFNGNIPAGAVREFTFTTPITPPPGYDNTLEVYTKATGSIAMDTTSITAKFMYQPNLTLYGYRCYNFSLFWNAAAIVSLNCISPEKLNILSNYRDGSNIILAGEYLNKKYYCYSTQNFITLSTTDWTVLSSTPITEVPKEMTYDYSTCTMYAIVTPEYDYSTLKTVNLETGELTTVGYMGRQFTTLACNLDGELYGVDLDGFIFRINKETAQPIVIYTSSLVKSPQLFDQSMAFDHNSGRLFWTLVTSLWLRLQEMDITTFKMYNWGYTGGSEGGDIVGLFTKYDPDPLGTTLIPADNAVNVAKNSEVSARFHFCITENNLSGITITYGDGKSVNNVMGYLVNNKLMITHDDFDYNTEYTVTVPAGAIVDYDQPVTWTFKTLAGSNVPTVTKNEVNIYPNPSTGLVNVKVSENSTVKVIDMTGRIIGTHQVNANSILNFNQSSGIYFIRVESKEKVSTHKIVINK